MIESKTSYFKEYRRFLFLLKIVTFFHLIWGITVKYLENEKYDEETFYFIVHRSLGVEKYKDGHNYPNIEDKLLEDRNNNDVENGTYFVSPYEKLSKRDSNNMGVLNRNYRNKFVKKRGLAKLDNYFEKKMFEKIDNIYELSKKMKNDKRSYKKKILNQYGYKLILFCLLPILGVILPLILGGNKFGISLMEFCNHTDHTTSNKNCTRYMIGDKKSILECSLNINVAFIYIMIIIVICFFLYSLIKIIKYEKLKAGKGKMSAKEYCRFCKDVFCGK